MDDPRPPKRTRQACEQCRRKKSRCPGERPACSYCQRLGQACEYAGDEEADYAKKMEQRVEGIEGKIDALMAAFNSQNQPFLPSPTATFSTRQPRPEPTVEATVSTAMPPASVARNAIHMFWTYCNFQPLPLFRHTTFPGTTENRDPELLLALQALGLRFSGGGISEPEIKRLIMNWTEESRRLVMVRVTEGSMELSTLQTLCILIFIDFTAGRSVRAGSNIRLAAYLLSNLRFGNAELLNLDNERDERLLCRWSLHMLGNLIGEPISVPRLDYTAQYASINKQDLGLAACAVQLSDVWGLARSYAKTHVAADSPPPWAPQSDYSRITFRHTEFESITPLRYRLHETRFDDLTGDDLQRRRDYWGHWLFFQLVFHSIPCLLNHPLLLSTRLRHFRHTMPQSFIQHSYEQITLHAGWVLHFIDQLETKNYEVSDPTFGQCVVVVATIYLQHSFVEDVFFRDKAQFGYDRCLTFLTRMARRWPNIERQVDNLRKLRSSISAGDVQNSRQTWSVNIQLLWDILRGTPPKQIASDIFGPGLSRDSALHGDLSTPETDFDLIGSAGISGHKTVARNLVTYFPPEQVLQPTPPDLSALLGDPGISLTGSTNNAFLQPQDYGRFIDNWLDLPT
ncbi:hypothetical protein BJY01DRAFT_118802 [Aspergillus pseudoustus]|uniref:Zn(2)-C6 fungal-type domain-containing protein n=1 Tax=Aspergillus pseudoustus TaxID=1810923 RepID=A0ABR4IRN0_9EURO